MHSEGVSTGASAGICGEASDVTFDGSEEYLRRVRDEVGRTYQCKEDYEDKESEVIESWDVYSPDDISP